MNILQRGVTLASRLKLIHVPLIRHYAQQTVHRYLYDVLGVEPTATQNQIKAAFYSMSKLHHPDITTDDTSRVIFMQASEAYEILGNSRLRRNYDRGLLNPKVGEGYHSPYGGVVYEAPEDEEGRQKSQAVHAPPSGYSDMYSFDDFYKRHYTAHFVRQQAQRADLDEKITTGNKRHNDRKIMVVLVLGLLVAVASGFGMDLIRKNKKSNKSVSE